ncbi:MAG: pyridoxal phosphate-dependent aminotransferase [Oscillospiraceae bacterium]|nr:pyridoxal phosphate-dependent aminotransferase [Oscillospiraceae bacterium]
MRFSQFAKTSEESPIRKFHPYAVQAEAAGKKIYHLNIGQPDIETPPAYLDAVHAFNHKVLEYAPSPGIPSLISEICRYYEGVGVSCVPDNVLITTGGSEALRIALICVLDPGEEIITPEPYYTNYHAFVTLTGGAIRPIPAVPEDGYHYAEREKLEAALTPKTRALLLTNPGNPTGTLLTREEMEMIADFVREHDLWLLVDEVYREFAYDDTPPVSFGHLDGLDDRLILIDSVSKRFSACGARVGCMISRNHDLIRHALKVCQARLSVGTVDQELAAALYRGATPEYYAAVRDEYKRRRDTVVRKLQAIPGVVCECPRGAFYLMAKLPVDDAEKFQIFLLDNFDDQGETVMFAPGRSFYATPGRGVSEIRIAYVLKQADLERAIDLLALGLKAYNER